MNISTGTKAKHIGRNISRLRELRSMKQEALAEVIGMSQQTISNIEGSEEIEWDKMAEIATALGVTPEALENFTEESILKYFNSNYSTRDKITTCFCTFNPLDKLVESFEENKKLYERLVLAEKAKAEFLEKLLKVK